MISKNVIINISPEAEERPVAVLVQIASQYESKIYLETEDKKINAKSIMGMMSLGLTKGENITVEADGADEEAAVIALTKYLNAEK